MKKYISIRNRKKSRGVAVIFTLGILGLLTVMALGFASTALLNRKIADNTSSADYARHIAKNIALARAKNAVMRNAVISNCYYSDTLASYTDANGKLSQDFLHKMDTVLDGVELYRVTNDSGAIQSNTARWQYVTDPNDSNRILGRYAYAVIPDFGRMDPNIHLGTSADAANRYGYSMQELSLPAGTSGSTDWKGSLTGKLTAPDRWRSFSEIFRCLGKDMAAPSADVRNILSDGISLRNSQSPETFWLDLNKDGKRTPEEMFLRFNLTRDWTTTTVDDLIGASSSSDPTLNDAGSAKSIGFIPWLKTWTYKPTGTTNWTEDAMKKQIAANIIQYNLPDTAETLADGPADWLSSTSESHPTYAGIGRHPMLNEIGFLVRVSTEVSFGTVTENDEKTKIKATYTPTFHITVDVGAELIYPFGPASDLDKNVEIFFSGKSHASNGVTFNDTVLAFDLRKFRTKDKPSTSENAQKTVDSLGGNLFQPANILNKEMLDSGTTGHNGDLDHISIRANGSWGKHITGTSTAVEWENGDSQDFKLTFNPSDWISDSSGITGSPAYTLAGKFWKQAKTSKQYKLNCTIRALEIETPKNGKGSLSEEAEYIASAIARRMTIEWKAFTPGTVVMKYGGKQRDIVYQLEDKTPSNGFAGDGVSGWYDMAGEEASPEKIWFISYEATDPLVNHYQSDWKTKVQDPEVQNFTTVDEGRLTSHGYYPGSLAGSDGNETATSHINSTIVGNLPLSLTVNGTTIQEKTFSTSDPTTTGPADPAYTEAFSKKRLSSSYIRHGQMKSLWELSFISRAEAFRTLNLAKVRTFAVGTSAADRKANTFADGDANILDQVKLSENTDASSDLLYPYGKINLNSTSHRVLEQVFNASVKWFESLRTSTTVGSPFDETDDNKKTTSTAVCSNSDCRKMNPCADPASCPHKYASAESPGCLAHLLRDRSAILPFSNRSDLLVEPTAAELAKLPGYSALSSDQQTKLAAAQENLRNWLLRTLDTTTLCKTEKEQYATRFMNLFCTEPVQHVYIVVLAQSIKDVGGSPAFVDWNGDGEYAPEDEIEFPVSAKGLKSGYVRKPLYNSGYELVGSKTKAKETITSTAIGTYDYGADKIIGETKLIVEMTRDVDTGKWKIAGYRYVE